MDNMILLRVALNGGRLIDQHGNEIYFSKEKVQFIYVDRLGNHLSLNNELYNDIDSEWNVLNY